MGDYPKILIVGEPFHLKSGGGITMTNLFRGWPGDRISVATIRIDRSGYGSCTSYYLLGYEENKRPWPFRLVQPKNESGPVTIDVNDISFQHEKYSYRVEEKHSGFKKKLLALRHYTGIYPFIYRLRVSERFLSWFDSYDPDVVYTHLSQLKYIDFVTGLVKKRKVPLVIHIMDDWPETLREPGVLYHYWKRIIDKRFRYLLDSSSALMSICKAMSDEYYRRYGKIFLPFQNTVEISTWQGVAGKDRKVAGTFTVLYAGRIGAGLSKSIHTIVDAVEKLGTSGFDIRFLMRTGMIPDDLQRKLDNCRFTQTAEFLPHDRIPAELAGADLLIIPLDFDEESVAFTRLSMPTKVPEFLASGTPVLVFAPAQTALFRYAQESGWGYTVAENDAGILAEAIGRLYNEMELREKLIRAGKEVVAQNHDGAKIRNEFRNALRKASDDFWSKSQSQLEADPKNIAR